MQASCKARTLAYLKRNAGTWFAKGHLCDLARTHGGYTGEMTGRRLRELAEVGEIEVKEEKGHCHYRYTGDSEAQRLKAIAIFDAL